MSETTKRKQVSATPHPRYLSALHRQNIPWWQRIAELIDNSFDAGANHVVVSLSGRKLAVRDNGRGVRDPIALIRLGDHQQHEAKGLGMYGVGLKDAWLSTGHIIEVDSVCDGVRTTMKVDARDLVANDWHFDEPETRRTDEANGTTIRISITNGLPSSTANTCDRLEAIFAPALRDGKRITFTDAEGRELTPAPLPPLAQVVSEQFQVDEKSVAINIGILPADYVAKGLPLMIQYRHRIIDSTYIGTKGRRSQRLSGTITIGDGWPIGKNKDVLIGCDEILGDPVHDRIAHLLEQCEAIVDKSNTADIELELARLLNSSVPPTETESETRREKRGLTSGQKGTVKPAHTGRKRRNAADTTDNPGSVEVETKTPKQTGLSMKFAELEDDTIGRFEASSSTVVLNLSHPVVAQWKQAANTHALFSVASAIVADYDAKHDEGQGLMGFGAGEFLAPFSKLISAVVTTKE